MGGDIENNGWTEWRKHVLLEIERINENFEKMDERYRNMCIDVAKLKVYAAVWGAGGGSVITLIVAIVVSRG